MAKLKISLMNRVRVSRLSYGIHPNTAISNVDLTARKRQGTPDKKMIHITFATVDATTRKKKAEVELSWFKLDHTSEYLFSNIRELCVQLHGILSCYMDEEESFKLMEPIFNEFKIADLDVLENRKWKKKELDSLMDSIKEHFGKAIQNYIGLDKDLIWTKITSDTKGEYPNIPKFGKFTEPMTVDKTTLEFSNYELKNHSKAGNISITGATVSAPEL